MSSKRNFTALANYVKKGCMVVSAWMIAFSAVAEGYQINSQSTRQLGMGHVGVALKLGSESMLFNPAGMAYMQHRFDISLGTTAIASKIKYTRSDYSAHTDNPIGTPLFGYIGYKPVGNLAVGISIVNPVGNSLKWPDNWAGSTLIEDISLKGFTVQPTISYKFSDAVSAGAGLMIDFGNVNLSRALIPVGGLAPVGGMLPSAKPLIDEYAEHVPVSATLKGNASASVGVNIGVLVNVSPKVSIGASYRSRVNLKVKKGNAKLNYSSPEIKDLIHKVNELQPGAIPIPPLESGTFEASLPAPHNINVGVAWKPIEDLTLSAELQFIGWQAYDTLIIQFDQNVLNGYSIDAPKNYKNTVIYRIGGQYRISDLATVRLGAYYDTTPVRDNLYNPETPGSNKLAITAGASLSPCKFMSVDIALAYLNGAQKYGSYPNPSASDPKAVFDGYYKARAWMPSAGLSFRF